MKYIRTALVAIGLTAAFTCTAVADDIAKYMVFREKGISHTKFTDEQISGGYMSRPAARIATFGDDMRDVPRSDIDDGGLFRALASTAPTTHTTSYSPKLTDEQISGGYMSRPAARIATFGDDMRDVPRSDVDDDGLFKSIADTTVSAPAPEPQRRLSPRLEELLKKRRIIK